MLFSYIIYNALKSIDSSVTYDRIKERVYFSTDKLCQLIGFRYCLNSNGKLKFAYMNGRKLTKRNALNILLTLEHTNTYFDFKNGEFYCKSWRKTWNYADKILVGLEKEFKENKLLNSYRKLQQ